ncbi:MAG: peptide deformylase [Pseudooceanicola sp.]
MAVLPILRWPDPRLSQPCAPVAADEDVSGLVADLFDTMYAAPGRGLAAPQVGSLKRVFVMDVTWKDGDRSPLVCINPEIVSGTEETAWAEEACLSIPGVSARIARPAAVQFRWTDADGKVSEARFSGPWATCAQHELDHLDGRVIFDRLGPADRARLEAAYEARA